MSTTRTSDSHVNAHEQRIDEEVVQLLADIRRISDGDHKVTFGALFDDELAQQYYEALVGTLKTAKKRKLIDFKGQMLLKGMHDLVIISISDAGLELEKQQSTTLEAESVAKAVFAASSNENDENGPVTVATTATSAQLTALPAPVSDAITDDEASEPDEDTNAANGAQSPIAAA